MFLKTYMDLKDSKKRIVCWLDIKKQHRTVGLRRVSFRGDLEEQAGENGKNTKKEEKSPEKKQKTRGRKGKELWSKCTIFAAGNRNP